MVQYGKKVDTNEHGIVDPFMFNIKAEECDLIELAARNTGVEIEIRDEAVSQRGEPLAGYIAVYSKGPQGPEHARFLTEYRRLVSKKQKRSHWR